MPQVNYNGKTVSDENIKTVLGRIATRLGGDVSVTSGDRNYVPQGGSQTSLHIGKRAADFSVSGFSLGSAFAQLKAHEKEIFDNDKKYEVIHHGTHTATGGPHLHVRRFSEGVGVGWLVEGLEATGKGVYSAG